MKLKVSQRNMQSLGRKGLNWIRILIRSVHMCSYEDTSVAEGLDHLS